MNKKRNYLFGFLLIAAALIYLMTTSFTSSLQYYITVNEALAATQGTYADKIIKIAGKARNIKRIEGQDKPGYTFEIIEGDHFISTTYEGFAPDTFKDGADVVATGTLSPDNHFQATHILAKCSSKYQAKTQGY